MINHARTLLLNVAGSPTGFSHGWPGEEYIPAEFQPLNLPQFLQNTRRILFGEDPDRLGLNVRVSQLLSLVHSLELEEFILSLDPRITYDRVSNDPQAFFQFGAALRSLSGPSARAYLVGPTAALPDTGRLYHSWHIRVLSGSTVEVTRQTPPHTQVVEEFTVTEGLAGPVPLVGSGYSLLFAPDVGTRWLLEIRLRHRRDLAKLVADFEQSRGTLQLLLKESSSREEPYLTLQRLWHRNHDLLYRLGAVVTAAVLQLDERWRAA